MKKNLLKIISIIVVSALTVSASGMLASCKNNVKNKEIKVYSASNNVKIRRDENYADKGKAELSFKMAKNETEGAQIIFVPYKNSEYNAIIEKDLVSQKGNRIYKSNVNVYAQHYVNVQVATTSFPLGYYPDALVPMRNYLEKRDNKVKAGENQGIYVTVKTSEQTPADVYKGNMLLVVNDEIINVPITVEVWDFTVPEERHAKTAFAIWESQIFPEELDNSEEMLKKYYEFFVERRVTPSYLPTYESGDMKTYVELVKEYTLREDIPCFRLYYTTKWSDEVDGWVLDLTYFENTLRSLIESSTAQINLMKKPYMYCSAIDEPNSAAAFRRVKYVNDGIYEIINKLAGEYSANGFFDDKPEVLESLLAFEHIVTTYYRENIADYVDTWCPYPSKYQSEEYYSNMLKEVEKGHGAWWYTCIQPKYPQPTYHVDDNLISSRALSWMQMKYGIEGNLYWATTIYKKYSNGSYIARDVWNDPLSFASRDGANGDGFLVYPGRKYGVDGPISSIRLESIREGMEDYEYLYVLDELIRERSKKFGLNTGVNDYAEQLYSMLFTGTIANTDVENIEFAREEIANLILSLKNPDCPVSVINGINGSNGTATVSVYADESRILVNGVNRTSSVKSGGGYRFTVSVPVADDMNYITVKTSKGEYKRFISTKVTSLCGFETSNEINSVTATKFASAADTEAFMNTDGRFIRSGKSSLKVKVTPAGNASYLRKISIPVSSVDFSDARNVKLSVFGETEKNISLTLSVTDANGLSYNIGNFYVKSGQWNDICLGVIGSGAIDLSNVRSVDICFPDIRKDTGYANPFVLYIDNLFIEKKY